MKNDFPPSALARSLSSTPATSSASPSADAGSNAEILKLDRRTLEGRSLRLRSALRAGGGGGLDQPQECTIVVEPNT